MTTVIMASSRGTMYKMPLIRMTVIIIKLIKMTLGEMTISVINLIKMTLGRITLITISK